MFDRRLDVGIIFHKNSFEITTQCHYSVMLVMTIIVCRLLIVHYLTVHDMRECVCSLANLIICTLITYLIWSTGMVNIDSKFSGLSQVLD